MQLAGQQLVVHQRSRRLLKVLRLIDTLSGELLTGGEHALGVEFIVVHRLLRIVLLSFYIVVCRLLLIVLLLKFQSVLCGVVEKKQLPLLAAEELLLRIDKVRLLVRNLSELTEKTVSVFRGQRNGRHYLNKRAVEDGGRSMRFRGRRRGAGAVDDTGCGRRLVTEPVVRGARRFVRRRSYRLLLHEQR